MDELLAKEGHSIMADVQVTCINKQPRNNPHEGITHLGGATWKWTRQQVIDSIKAGANTFYTQVGGKRAEVGVVNGPNGEYVTSRKPTATGMTICWRSPGAGRSALHGRIERYQKDQQL